MVSNFISYMVFNASKHAFETWKKIYVLVVESYVHFPESKTFKWGFKSVILK